MIAAYNGKVVGKVHPELPSSSVSVLDGDEVVYVARVSTRRIMTVAISVGTRFPAYATSMGRVLLAGLAPDALAATLDGIAFAPLTGSTITTRDGLVRELDEIRERGWALVDEELEAGLRSVPRRSRDRDGAVAAAINLSAHAARTTVAEMKRRLLAPLLDTAAAIERDLAAGSWPGSDQ